MSGNRQKSKKGCKYRKRIGEQCVSESRARKCLEENDLERLRDLIPDSTREILFFREE